MLKRGKFYTIILTLILIVGYSVSPTFAQRHYQLKLMRDDMVQRINTYSFGYSWDNKIAYSQLTEGFEKYDKIISKSFLWKTTPKNVVEKDYFRLAANFAIGTMENQAEIDPVIERLLNYDPFLIPTETDNLPDLKEQIKGFYPLPSLKAGIKVGLNYYSRNVQNSNEIIHSQTSDKKFSSNLGWHIALPVNYLVRRNLSIGLEPGLSFVTFNFEEQYLGNFQTFKYRIYYFDLPIIFRTSLINPRFSGFGNIGKYHNDLVVKTENQIESLNQKVEVARTGQATGLERRKSNKEVKRDHLEMNSPFKRLIPYAMLGVSPKIRLNSLINSETAKEITNLIQVDLVTGIGFEWINQNTTYNLEVRYNLGLMNINNEEPFYILNDVSALIFNEYYVSDDYKIQSVEISIIMNYVLNQVCNLLGCLGIYERI